MRIERRQVDGSALYCAIHEDGHVSGYADRVALLKDAPNAQRAVCQALDVAAPQVPCEPTKVVCVGLNYRQHAEEMGKAIPETPLIFLKPTTALIAHGETIVRPRSSDEVHHEGELAIVIGQRAKNVAAADAWEHILGLTLMNDVTARDIQRAEGKYTRGKGFDTFAPLGPTIVTGLDPNALQIELRVNGEVRQRSGCDDMIFDVPAIIEFVSSVMTLLPGDVISTGTPSGVGPIHAGDVVEVEIPEIGVLRSQVADAS